MGNEDKDKRALRFNKGKPELFYVLTFPKALEGVAKVATFGASKYSAFNYLHGAPASESINSAMRHLLYWFNGENFDNESSLHHLEHFAWNALRFVDEMLGDKAEQLDDRPHIVLAKEKNE